MTIDATSLSGWMESSWSRNIDDSADAGLKRAALDFCLLKWSLLFV
jgi:hypothetical protein